MDDKLLTVINRTLMDYKDSDMFCKEATDVIVAKIKEEVEGVKLTDGDIVAIKPSEQELNQLYNQAKHFCPQEFSGSYFNEIRRKLVDRKIAEAMKQAILKIIKGSKND